MKESTFLSNSDRYDLFEKIKKIGRNVGMADDDVQDLLDAIGDKFRDINNEIWNNIVTISFTGPDSVEKSKMMDRVLQQGFYNNILIESNKLNHYIRYTKIQDEKEITIYVTCEKCGSNCLSWVYNQHIVCDVCNTKMIIKDKFEYK